VLETGILKINNLPQLWKEQTTNFSHHSDSGSESCQDSFFSEVYLLLLTQSLVRLSRHTHRNGMSQPKYGQIVNCGLAILIVSLFSLWRLRIATQITVGLLAVIRRHPQWFGAPIVIRRPGDCAPLPPSLRPCACPQNVSEIRSGLESCCPNYMTFPRQHTQRLHSENDINEDH